MSTPEEIAREGGWRSHGYRVRFPEEGFVNIAGQDHEAFIEIMKRAGAEIVFDPPPRYYLYTNTISNHGAIYGVTI